MSVVPDKTDEYVYFLYSSSQYDMRTEIESGVNKKFIPGKVLVKGEWREFTQISKSPSSAMFADSNIVAEGFKSKMNFKDCTNVWKK